MSTFHEVSTEPVSKVQRVRLAANTLGISERTVYRRLRSGKLEELPTETLVADSVMSYGSDAVSHELILSQIQTVIERLTCQIDMTNDKLSVFQLELAGRDDQIRILLENQQELTRTIQNLQGQIYELARLALLQTATAADRPMSRGEAVANPVVPQRSGVQNWLRSLWRRDKLG
jgi:hypothetical protein